MLKRTFLGAAFVILGASLPVVPNSTNANRAKNRRIQITLVPILPSNLSSNIQN